MRISTKPILLIFTILLTTAFVRPASTQEQTKDDSWKKTRAIRGLPFCAMILGNNPKGPLEDRRIYVLMEQEDINEGNLGSLFRLLSEENPEPDDLMVSVFTDVRELTELVNGGGMSHGANKILSGARYTRRKDRESFGFNPNFPNEGMRIVIMLDKNK